MKFMDLQRVHVDYASFADSVLQVMWVLGKAPRYEVCGCICSVGKRSCWCSCPVFAWLSALSWSHDRLSRSSLCEVWSSFFRYPLWITIAGHFVYSGVIYWFINFPRSSFEFHRWKDLCFWAYVDVVWLEIHCFKHADRGDDMAVIVNLVQISGWTMVWLPSVWEPCPVPVGQPRHFSAKVRHDLKFGRLCKFGIVLT